MLYWRGFFLNNNLLYYNRKINSGNYSEYGFQRMYLNSIKHFCFSLMLF